MPDAPFRLDNSYARELPGCYVAWPPAPVQAPQLLYFNRELAAELGIEPGAHDEKELLFAGNALPEGAEPIAQAYAGHQFGGFSPQLGDGRALLLGESSTATAGAATSPSRARAARRSRAAATARPPSARCCARC
jgi:uncharacterized protein YdiU (UPF0061 family)